MDVEALLANHLLEGNISQEQSRGAFRCQSLLHSLAFPSSFVTRDNVFSAAFVNLIFNFDKVNNQICHELKLPTIKIAFVGRSSKHCNCLEKNFIFLVR